MATAALDSAVSVLVVLFWLAVTDAQPLAWRQLPRLMVYPLAYLVCVFARGDWVGLYSYKFVNVLATSYRAALFDALGLMTARAALMGLLLGLKALTGKQTAARFL